MFPFKQYITQIIVNHDLAENEMTIPINMANKWRLLNERYVTLTYHLFSIKANLTIIDKLEDDTLEIAPNILSHLYLPLKNVQCLYDSKNETLHFGPSFGVLLGNIDLSKPDSYFGSITPYLIKLSEKGRALYIPVIIFTINNLESLPFVEGFTYENDTWIKEKHLLPQVIYNRIAKRSDEKLMNTSQFINKLTEWKIPFFNTRYIHKWESYQIFSKEPIIQPYLPETAELYSGKQLIQMLNKHQSVYLKPSWGSKGAGIIRIDKNEGSSYLITCSDNEMMNTTSLSSDQELYRYLRKKLRKRKYIIQQTIRTGKIDDTTIDYRILCIKDKWGKWKACSSIARLSKKKAIVNNLSQGGTQLKTREALMKMVTEDEAVQTELFMKELAQFSAQILEKEVDGIFGELGFDFMLDENNHVWMLEVNIKPSKEMISISGDHNTSPFKSIRLLLSYASYLFNDLNS